MTAAPLTIDFRAEGNSLSYTAEGWSAPEPQGRWSDGPGAVLRLRLTPGPRYRLTLDALPFCQPTLPAQRLILASGSTVLFDAPCDGPLHLVVEVPAGAVAPNGNFVLQCRFPDAARASDHGVAGDGRMLGFFFGQLTLEALALPAGLAAEEPRPPIPRTLWRLPLDPAAPAPDPAPAAPAAPAVATGAAPKVAAVTMAYNEPVYLPIWQRHYTRQVGAENCFVIDHGSDDGSCTPLAGVQVVRIPRSPYDPILQSEFAARFCASLLCWYDRVVFSDVDEILVVDPQVAPTITEYCRRDLPDVVNAIGLNVQHVPALEPRFDAAQPVLRQRNWVFACSPMCKPLLIRRPVIWPGGAHSADAPVAFDHLYNFHLRWFDLDLGLARIAKTRSMAWAHEQSGGHQRVPDATFLSQFHRFADMPRLQGVPFDPQQEPLRSFLTAVEASQAGREQDPYHIDLDIWWGQLWQIPERFRGAF